LISLEEARAWYPHGDAVHGFEHVLRVYHLAERIAQAEGADLEIVRAAALLHDAGEGRLGSEEERHDHHHSAADFAAQVLSAKGWEPERIEAVQHCIRTHRFRSPEEPGNLEAKVLFDADKLDAIGAVGVARALAYAVQAGEPIYSTPSQHFLETGERLPGEPHSAYHEYLFKLVTLKDRLYTDSAKVLAADRHAVMVDYFEALAAEMQEDR